MTRTQVILFPVPGNLPELVRRTRKQQRLTVEAIARVIRVDASWLAKLERGRWKSIDIGIAAKLARVLDEPAILAVAMRAAAEELRRLPQEAV
ncbi:MAG: helix-turn-helix domain-containing protein [Firmicutes bacterium]|nr:helix-turn-helix domain-containing protein [Bacillota bacterium]